jgi:multidrug resistance efflux pump
VQVVPAEYAEMSFLLSAPVREIAVTEGETVKAGQTLISLNVPDLEYAVKAAEAALKSALADEYIQSQGRRKWDGFKFVWMSGPPEQRQVAHAKVVEAQANLDAASAERDQARLIAPFDGSVVAIRTNLGEVVRPGQAVLVIGDLGHLQVETTDLSEREISRVRLGDSAQIRLKALADTLMGKVTAIEPKGGMSPDGDVIYRVTLVLDQQPSQVMWGMTGEVEIEASG